jgi:hypothetical protein
LLTELHSHGISEGDLDALNAEFETFWNVALGKMAGMDTIDAVTGVSESIELSRAYFKAFDDVRSSLVVGDEWKEDVRSPWPVVRS